MPKSFGLGITLKDDECNWAWRKAIYVHEKHEHNDGSFVGTGKSLWNNYHGSKAEAAVRRFVGYPLGEFDAPDPGWDISIGLEGLRVDVKSYIHNIHERIQLVDNYWPIRADLIVVVHCERGRDSRAVQLRGWAHRDELWESAFTWAPPKGRTGGKQWKKARWINADLLRSIWDLPCPIAVWPPESARREAAKPHGV